MESRNSGSERFSFDHNTIGAKRAPIPSRSSRREVRLPHGRRQARRDKARWIGIAGGDHGRYGGPLPCRVPPQVDAVGGRSRHGSIDAPPASDSRTATALTVPETVGPWRADSRCNSEARGRRGGVSVFAGSVVRAMDSRNFRCRCFIGRWRQRLIASDGLPKFGTQFARVLCGLRSPEIRDAADRHRS
jgi:hypothetical protein